MVYIKNTIRSNEERCGMANQFWQPVSDTTIANNMEEIYSQFTLNIVSSHMRA